MLGPPSFFKFPRLWLQHALTPYTGADKKSLAYRQWFEQKGRGYFYEQSTQPQTLGYSLADSPAGLLAWIYEKLVAWTDAYSWEDDEGGHRALLMYLTDGDPRTCGGSQC